jgi:YidC/Oxa1 family membrane protein insertase
MERNLLLAFVITLVIMLAWSRLMGPGTTPQQPVQEPSGAVTTQVAEPGQESERPTEAEKPAASAAKVDLLAEKEKARDVVIETDLVEATFTTLGARVKSIKLKEPYEGVDIAPHGEDEEVEAQLGMTLHKYAGGDLPDKLNFEVEKDGYDLRFKRELGNGLVVTKEFRFNGGNYDNAGNYDIEMTIGIENRGTEMVYVGEDEEPSYVLRWGPGLENKQSDRYNRILFAAMNDGLFLHKGRGLFKGIKSAETYRELSWLGLKSRYFLILIAPLADELSVGRVRPIGKMSLEFELSAHSFRLGQGESKTNKYIVYAGPQHMALLKEVGLDLRLEKAVNFGFDALSKPMLKILKLCHKVVPNYGVGIIVLTIIVRMGLYPLTHKSMQSMKKMQVLQPEIAKLKEKYKDNPQELNRRTMAFYKEQGVNPMGGCLPMMLQMPIWFALFRVYNGAIELRGAPFIWWITDLSEPDTIATLPFSLPFFGNEVHVLPLLMAGAMFLQQKLMSPGGSGQTDQQRMMAIIFPVMFGLLFYHMPSGLCLYIFVSTMLYFVQQLITHKGAISTPEAQAVTKK